MLKTRVRLGACTQHLFASAAAIGSYKKCVQWPERISYPCIASGGQGRRLFQSLVAVSTVVCFRTRSPGACKTVPLKVAFCPDGLSRGDVHKCISWPLKTQTFNPGSLCVPPMEAFLSVYSHC